MVDSLRPTDRVKFSFGAASLPRTKSAEDFNPPLFSLLACRLLCLDVWGLQDYDSFPTAGRAEVVPLTPKAESPRGGAYLEAAHRVVLRRQAAASGTTSE